MAAISALLYCPVLGNLGLGCLPLSRMGGMYLLSLDFIFLRVKNTHPGGYTTYLVSADSLPGEKAGLISAIAKYKKVTMFSLLCLTQKC